MWNDNDKITHLIVRLIGLTNSGKIKWQREPSQTQVPSQAQCYINYVYIAQVGDDIFRLSESEYKNSYDEQSYEWERVSELDIVDKKGLTLWHCPANPAIHDLFRIVVEDATDIDGIMNRLDLLAQAS